MCGQSLKLHNKLENAMNAAVPNLVGCSLERNVGKSCNLVGYFHVKPLVGVESCAYSCTTLCEEVYSGQSQLDTLNAICYLLGISSELLSQSKWGCVLNHMNNLHYKIRRTYLSVSSANFNDVIPLLRFLNQCLVQLLQSWEQHVLKLYYAISTLFSLVSLYKPTAAATCMAHG